MATVAAAAAQQPKSRGAHYTPAELAERLLEETLGAWLERHGRAAVARIRIVDPACGDGAILVPAYARLLRAYEAREGSLDAPRRLEILRAHIHGVDIDAGAIARCGARLLALAGQGDAGSLSRNLRVGDALVGSDASSPQLEPFDWRAAFGDAGFDVVVGNPPYVDSETLVRERPSLREYCRQRYASARGNWDLFCPFIELALCLLREGGMHGFVVPNRLASADYAQHTRALLARHHLRWLGDYASASPFDAATYPLAYAVEHGATGARELVRFERIDEHGVDACNMPTDAFGSDGWPLGDATAAADYAALSARWPPLGESATVLGAATVAEAYALVRLLCDEATPNDTDLRVINSGTIDPFQSLWGDKRMRYLGARFRCPVVRAEVQAALPPRRLEQARMPKVIVAGMTKQLEALADTEGRLLAAKSTTIVLPRDPRDVPYLEAVLNSRLMSHLMRTRFSGLAMAGGYLRIGPPQLRRLPVRPVDWDDPTQAGMAAHIVELAATPEGRGEALERAIVEYHGPAPE